MRRRGLRGRGQRRRGGDQIDREGGDDDDDESESESYDNDNSDDADPEDLTGKYDGKGNKKGKGGRCGYRDDNEIEALHGL